jgi:hypothetical protein
MIETSTSFYSSKKFKVKETVAPFVILFYLIAELKFRKMLFFFNIFP